MTDSADELDEALERLTATAPEYSAGLSNHGPMVCEVLMTSGHPEAIHGWLDHYLRDMEPAMTSAGRLDVREWRAALGVPGRYPEWVMLFEAALAEQPWEAVVAEWVPRFSPGALGGATHGLIRTAHAVRGLGEAATPPRLAELARALGYWAACFAPVRASEPLRGQGGVAAALRVVPGLPAGERVGLQITGASQLAAGRPGFAGAVASVASPADAATFLVEVASAMADWYLAHRETEPIAFVHGITAPAALLLLLPHLGPGEGLAASVDLWRACAAIRAAYASALPLAGQTPAQVDWDDLQAEAIGTGGAHAIKLVEACRRLRTEGGAPALGAAALDGGRRLTV